MLAAAGSGPSLALVTDALLSRTSSAAMIGRPTAFDAGEVEVSDAVHAPGYGRLNDAVREAMAMAARLEGLLLDPVYTGKAMAGLVAHVRSGRIAWGSRVLFVLSTAAGICTGAAAQKCTTGFGVSLSP